MRLYHAPVAGWWHVGYRSGQFHGRMAGGRQGAAWYVRFGAQVHLFDLSEHSCAQNLAGGIVHDGVSFGQRPEMIMIMTCGTISL